MSLSVIVITRNEALHIGACLASVDFADEWVVVDGGSTDGTREIAAARGARVLEGAEWPGFGAQKNKALDAALGDWVLSIDADERATPELAAQIRAVTSAATGAPNAPAAYTVARLSAFCGQWMLHGDWYPDPVLRLFRRGQARFTDDQVHERVVVDPPAGSAAAPIGRLDGHLLHHSMPSLESCLDKMNRYSSDSARERWRSGKRGGLLAAIGHGVWAFARSYVVRRGFLDGQLGFVVALSIAEGTYYRYLKMWLLDRSASSTATVPVAPPAT